MANVVRHARPTATPRGPLDWVIDSIAEFGAFAQFCGATVLWMFRRPMRASVLAPTMYAIGVLSVPVVAVSGTFIGMVLAIQAYNQFNAMGMASRLGSVVNISLVKELGPVLAAAMLAGRVGSAMAAELGTMKVTEQIDALQALGASPLHYLVAPRFLASVLLIPLLTAIADFMGVVGGAMVSTKMLGIDPHYYWLYSEGYVDTIDIFAGLLKSIFFGGAIALISCYRGLNSAGGAEGVGQAATKAFVTSFLAILFLDFWIGLAWNNLYYAIWPGTAGLV